MSGWRFIWKRLVLAVVLACGIGTFVLARITYEDAFY